VGRLVLRLSGRADERLDRLSDELCTGLQLANFLQDLSVDLPRGRLYLPLEDLESHGCSPSRLLAGEPSGDLEGLLARQLARTLGFLDRGAPLARHLKGRFAFWVRWVARGGRTIVQRSERLGPRLLRERPTLRASRRLAAALAALGDGARGR
jgi:phytoene/squalene synthetase